MTLPIPERPASRHATGTPTPFCEGCCTRLDHVGVSLGGTRVLHDVCLHTHCGELTVLAGPNGAGKTTLLRAILGEVPHEGTIRFAGPDGVPVARRPRVGYVPQRLELDATAPVSVLDLLAAARTRRPLWLGISGRRRADAHAALARVEAEPLLDAPLGALSAGQLQRVLLALALEPLPELLVLDEPVAGVDRAGTDLFYRLLSRLRLEFHLGVLLVSHDLSTAAQVADRMILLHGTVLADGPPAEVLRSDPFRRLFGLDLVPPVPAAEGATAPRTGRWHRSQKSEVRSQASE